MNRCSAEKFLIFDGGRKKAPWSLVSVVSSTPPGLNASIRACGASVNMAI